MAEPIQIGILLYPNVTQLDATGPAQVLSRVFQIMCILAPGTRDRTWAGPVASSWVTLG